MPRCKTEGNCLVAKRRRPRVNELRSLSTHQRGLPCLLLTFLSLPKRDRLIRLDLRTRWWHLDVPRRRLGIVGNHLQIPSAIDRPTTWSAGTDRGARSMTVGTFMV